MRYYLDRLDTPSIHAVRGQEIHDQEQRLGEAIADATRTGRKTKAFGLLPRTQMARRIRNGTNRRAANALVARLKKEGL
jgi:hypothetical protein